MKFLMNTELALLFSSLITQHAAAASLSRTNPILGHLLATLFVNGIPKPGKFFPVLPVPSLANLSNRFSSSMLLPSFGPGGVTLSCAGVQSVSFRVQRAPTPAGPWTTIASATIGENSIGTCLDPAPAAGNAFYRATCP
jgi:hypothetical protein